MRIGIATIYDSLNCGSYLQAYAMQNIVERLGHEAYILDCHKSSCKHLLNKWLSRTDLVFNIRQQLRYGQDLKKLHITKSTEQELDAVIIGSDEVWNIKGYFEHSPEFFGDHLNTDRIIAYGPSIGYLSVNDFVKTKEAQKIKGFHAVFPRDEVTKEACKIITGCEYPIVCDPTILLWDEWEKHIRAISRPEKPYVLYYSYLDNTPMKEHIIRYAHDNGFEIVIANFNYSWGDEVAIPSPLQFLGLIKNAECIFTSTFHGSVFSTLFEKQLIVRPSGQKVENYLHRLGLDNKIYKEECSYDEFVQQIRTTIEYAKIKEKFEKMKSESMELLKSSFE